MEKNRISIKEILLVIIYLLVIVSFRITGKLGILSENPLIRIILFFLLIIGITLLYLLFAQKEKFSIIASRTKKSLSSIIIPFIVSGIIIINLPTFIPINTVLYKLILILILSIMGIWMIIHSRKKR